MSSIIDIPYESLIKVSRKTESYDIPDRPEEFVPSENVTFDELSKHIERDSRRYAKAFGR